MARRLLLLLLLWSAGCVWAQPAGDLVINASLAPGDTVATTRVAVEFTNASQHALALPTDNVVLFDQTRLPTPPDPSVPVVRGIYFPSIFGCAVLWPGFVTLHYRFAAANREVHTQCLGVRGVEITAAPPDILQRTKSWIILQPGASVTREAALARFMPIQAGSYVSVHAQYVSPKFSSSDQSKLDQAGIVIPSGTYTSASSFSFKTDGQSLTAVNDPSPNPVPKPKGQHQLYLPVAPAFQALQK